MYAIRWMLAPLALCIFLSAQTGVKIFSHGPNALTDAKSAVRHYCDMDAQGFRLNRDAARRMPSVTDAKAASEWHAIQIISDFQITGAKLNAKGALITVSYGVLGQFDVGDEYSPDPRVETVEVQAVNDGSDWKIENGGLGTPHVLRQHALKWLREQAVAEKDAERKRALLQAIEELS